MGATYYCDDQDAIHTEYAYDTRNRLTEIAHKDGSTVKQSLGYTLDDDGTITKITHEDGSYWDYDYDGRNRLIAADRKSASTNIVAKYAYTYDASDNMLTKTEPFEDTFNDAVFDGWPTWSGTWTAAGGVLAKTSSGDGAFRKHTSDADGEFRMDYRITDTGTNDFFRMRLRSIAPDDYIYVQIRPALITLVKKINGVWTVLDSQSVSTTEDQWYTLRAEYEGSDVTVWRSTDGELESEILTTSNAEPTTSSLVALSLHDTGGGATAYEFDNVRILADDLDTETTFTVNDADELISSATTYGGTTYYEYDAWGRMTRKYMGTSGSPTFEATYDYKYDDKLVAVDSDFPDEGNVSYTYGADGQRRSRTADGVTEFYNWAGGDLINVQGAGGVLNESFVGKLANVPGSDPTTGVYSYNISDILLSVRKNLDAQANTLSQSTFSPFGESLEQTGVDIPWAFGGHQLDSNALVYLCSFRNYDAGTSRWTSREPLGLDGPNLYWYCYANPATCYDETGLLAIAAPVGVFIAGGAIGGGILGLMCGLSGKQGWDNIIGATIAGAVTGATVNAVLAGVGVGSLSSTAAIPLAIGIGAFGGFATGMIGSGGDVNGSLKGAGWSGFASAFGVPTRSLVDIGLEVSFARGLFSRGSGFMGADCESSK